MDQKRVININSNGEGGIYQTPLPKFLNDMNHVPAPAKNRSVIVASTLRHIREAHRLRHGVTDITTFLSISTHNADLKMLKAVNEESWDEPVIIVASLHMLAFSHALKRIGKIAFYGNASMLPSDNVFRMRIEALLYQE